jgi:lysophospholipase L1-like esterase
MKYPKSLTALVMSAGIGLVACSGDGSQDHKEPLVDLSIVSRDMQTIANARILLGHQSVGRNVLAGLKSLSAETGVPLRIVEIDVLPPDDQPGVFHTAIGNNGNPDGKCEVFSLLLTRPEQPKYDVAMMKFCYVDLGAGTPLSVDAMLERYERMTRGIREQRPDVQLVHVSLPLMADPPGKKTYLKRLLNRSTERDQDNVLRNAYNAGLRERYEGEPLFDLAAVESTLPNGERSYFMLDDRPVYTLAKEYTEDGGHLNDIGQRRAAAEFVRTLAQALQKT